MNVFAVILTIGIFAFIIWQIVGIVKDVKKRKEKKLEKIKVQHPPVEAETDLETEGNYSCVHGDSSSSYRDVEGKE